MKFHTILLAAAATALIGHSVQAAVIASYQFNSGAVTATTADVDLTAGSFAFATGFTTNTGFSGTGGNAFARVNATAASTLANAITDNDFITVTITPDSGLALNLTSLTVDLGYSLDGAAVPSGIGVTLNTSVFSSVDGFTAPSVLGTKTYTAASQGPTGTFYENLNIDLSGASYQNLSAPLEFRIYFYDSTSAISQPIHRIDNFTLNGSVDTLIPEPSAAALGGLGLLFLLRRRRR